MANILQVTNPALNTETRNIGNNPALNNPLAGQEIKNPVDPSRVCLLYTSDAADDQKAV